MGLFNSGQIGREVGLLSRQQMSALVRFSVLQLGKQVRGQA
jgi:hypothetical protein